ncbi:TIGR02452 family protein [Phytohabitans flavus]|uniref:TIGR02452 family protein n=1 Tax=Phytohabitans flavus TaxID=1076124 RepID=A0A6F8XQ86_9ACTN|nr:TIGR02452 family protein [Phytohabitans flavus]BCB75980.1 TIGR02452 family protein [Phytohabitans flavus]
MTNQRLRAVAADTVAISQAGGYRARTGKWVDIRDAVRAAVAGTRLYAPGDPLPAGAGRTDGGVVVEVTNESTLAAARRLGDGTAALVFASARNPGGGFLSGARAQEEDVARASALHACLSAVPAFYLHHRTNADLRYSDRVIYSPSVPVFRDDSLRLLDRPYRTAMLTSAAPNLRAILANQPDLADSVPAVLLERALRVVEVAAAHGHRRLVLGAWGCGVFGNDPATVAAAFAVVLDRVHAFDHVVFAVLDRAPGTPTYNAFVAAASSTV